MSPQILCLIALLCLAVATCGTAYNASRANKAMAQNNARAAVGWLVGTIVYWFVVGVAAAFLMVAISKLSP